MKIIINEDITLDEVQITINCKQTDENILKLIASLRSYDKVITGSKGQQTYLISPSTVLYIESVDKKTFIYCENDVYETPLRLYEIEEQFSSDGFFRASKSTIINLYQVNSLCPDFSGRIILTMSNKEKIVVSRQYSGNLKEKLGI